MCECATQPRLRRASSPRVLSGSRARRSPCSFPLKGRAEHRAFYRARGATWVNHVASCAFRAHDSVCRKHTVVLPCTRQRPRTQRVRLRSAREWISRLAPCPKRRRFRLRLPVRASCRPDMHLGRPPVLPASVPCPLPAPEILTTALGPASWRPPHPAIHATKTIATRPVKERDGKSIILAAEQSKNYFY